MPYKFLLLCSLLITIAGYSQVGINNSGAAPHASAMLDISSTNKGVLIPSVSLSTIGVIAPLTSPATGLLVWNNNPSVVGGNGTGFYFWDGSKWQNLLTENGGWRLQGNAGTTPFTHFIGTTDNKPLFFKVNNLQAGKIDHQYNNMFWGPLAGFGWSSTAARRNTFMGDSAGYSNTTGSDNSFLGQRAGQMITGAGNSFVGSQAGIKLNSGNNNSFYGFNSGTALGSISNASAIGYAAQVDTSNAMVLGSIAGVNGANADTRVGIGTNKPAYTFHVVNNKTGDGGWSEGILVENTTAANIGEAGISFRNPALPSNKQWTIGLNQNPQLAFSYGTNFSGANSRLIIDTTGAVGIGTLTPEAKLDVNGPVKFGTLGTVINNIIKVTVNVDIDGNLGLLSGSSFTTTFPVPGTLPGATVYVSTQFVLLGGLSIAYTRVPSAGMVELKVTNGGSTGVNHGPMDLYVSVIQ